MASHRRAAKRRSQEHLRAVFMASVGAGAGMKPTGIRSKNIYLVKQEEPDPDAGLAFVRLPRGLTVATPKTPRRPFPSVVSWEEPERDPGAVLFRQPSMGFGILGSGPGLTLLWHVEAEFRVYTTTGPNVPAVDGDPVTLWGDLVNGKDLTAFPVGSGQIARYQTAVELGASRADIQSGKDWRVIFQGNFNFMSPTAQLTYCFIGRVMETTMTFMSDGTPGVNGFAFGFGCNGSLEDTSGLNQSVVGVKEALSFEDSGLNIFPNCGLVVTYDGLNGGMTHYYILHVVTGQGQVDAGTPFAQQAFAATGGFALGGSYNNADPNRFANSLSNVEAAVWQGIMPASMIQDIANSLVTYWNYT
jgi:hypothetical protein